MTTAKNAAIKPKTSPAIEAAPPIASMTVDEQGQHIEASVGKEGFTLKLSPQIAEQVGRWLYRLLTLGGLGYIAIGGVAPSQQPALDQIAEVRAEVTRMHKDIDKILDRLPGKAPTTRPINRPEENETP